jgi:hypothetical protein
MIADTNSTRPFRAAPNKRMQMDLLKRYALSSAADAGRYGSLQYSLELHTQ